MWLKNVNTTSRGNIASDIGCQFYLIIEEIYTYFPVNYRDYGTSCPVLYSIVQ